MKDRLLAPDAAEVLRETRGVPFVEFKDLADGHICAGRCRNARLARWDAGAGLFTYWRHKFSPPRFTETIEHVQTDTCRDVFTPVGDMGAGSLEDLPEWTETRDLEEENMARADYIGEK